jgi:hypothetical protein
VTVIPLAETQGGEGSKDAGANHSVSDDTSTLFFLHSSASSRSCSHSWTLFLSTHFEWVMAGLVRMVQVDVGVLAACGHIFVVPGVTRPTGVVFFRVDVRGVGDAVGPATLRAQALNGLGWWRESVSRRRGLDGGWGLYWGRRKNLSRGRDKRNSGRQPGWSSCSRRPGRENLGTCQTPQVPGAMRCLCLCCGGWWHLHRIGNRRSIWWEDWYLCGGNEVSRREDL